MYDYDKYFIKKKIKTYIISLNKPTNLFKKLEAENIEPILIEAVDGNNLDYKMKSENSNLFFSLFGPNVTIAIALSHIKAWNEILKSKEKYGVVFEDDVVLVDNFYNKFSEVIKKVPKDFDMFYLGCFGCQNNDNILSIIFDKIGASNSKHKKINNLINKPSVALALHGYVISRKGIKNILKILDKNKIFFHLDYCIQKMNSDNLIKVYSAKNRLAYQNSTDNTVSSNVKNYHPLILNKFLSNFDIDTKCKASYFTTVSLLGIGKVTLTISSLLMIFLGVYLAYINTSFVNATIFYLLISSLDLYNIKSIKNTIPVMFHYLIFIIAFLIASDKF